MDLIFDGRIGLRPDPGSLEETFLTACSRENRRLWTELRRYPFEELVEAVYNLRPTRMGIPMGHPALTS